MKSPFKGVVGIEIADCFMRHRPRWSVGWHVPRYSEGVLNHRLRKLSLVIDTIHANPVRRGLVTNIVDRERPIARRYAVRGLVKFEIDLSY